MKVPPNYVPQSPTREHKRGTPISATTPLITRNRQSVDGAGSPQHIARSLLVTTKLTGRDEGNNKSGSFMSEDTVLNEEDADTVSSEAIVSAGIVATGSNILSATRSPGLQTIREDEHDNGPTGTEQPQDHKLKTEASSSSKPPATLPHRAPVSALASAAAITPRRSSRRKRDSEDDPGPSEGQTQAGGNVRSVSVSKRKRV
jgi:hypothetical protein